MQSKKSASRLFLGTFLEFMSCMDKSESVKIVIPKEVGKLLRSIFNPPNFNKNPKSCFLNQELRLGFFDLAKSKSSIFFFLV